MIISETAKVWRTSHGRRFLTKRAAYMAEAMHRLKSRHDPMGDGHDRDFFTNEQWDHFKKVSARYHRRFGRRSA